MRGMKTVYFVRHGEGENNAKNTEAYVAANARLTPKGHEQAKVIAERASHIPVDAIVSSTMTRAHQTAEYASQKIGKPVELTDLFIERLSPTSLVGQPWNNAETQRIEAEWVTSNFVEGMRVLDGHNFDDIKERGRNALLYLEARPESNILVFTHGHFLKMLFSHVVLRGSFTGAQFQLIESALKTKNTGLTVFTHDPDDERAKWIVRVWNDHSHLADS